MSSNEQRNIISLPLPPLQAGPVSSSSTAAMAGLGSLPTSAPSGGAAAGGAASPITPVIYQMSSVSREILSQFPEFSR